MTAAKWAEEEIQQKLDADVLYFDSTIDFSIITYFRDTIEQIGAHHERRSAIAIVLTSPGGYPVAVEKLVEIVRHHYKSVYFIVPVIAMSAGTIFCMSGDKIYMDYTSSLGPIDPQVPDRENRTLIPALGHIDKIDEIVEKSRNGTITPVEYEWFLRQDFGIIQNYRQAYNLSVALIEKWLVQFKFKDWDSHRTTNPGARVTDDEKRARAKDIARLLSDNAHWHSHGRMIGLQTLRDVCRLEIDDFGLDPDLRNSIRRYSDTLTDVKSRRGFRALIFSSLIRE